MANSAADKQPRLAAVLTVSDSAHEGTRTDASGPAVARLEAAGFAVTARSIVPDDRARIADELREMVLTTSARSDLHNGRDRTRSRATSPLKPHATLSTSKRPDLVK